MSLIGNNVVDVYLNDQAYWRSIPARAWDAKIGGFQVAKKWFSYREESLLGHGLTPEEAREFNAIVRRLTAIILMAPALNDNYRACRGKG